MITAIRRNNECDAIVKWRLTRNCNFKCSYCIQQECRKIQGFFGTLEEDIKKCMSAVKNVSRIIDEMPSDDVRLTLVGGECTLFDLEELLSKITSKKMKSVYIVTNFHKKTGYFKSLADMLSKRECKLSLCASWHAEFLSFEEYSSKMLELKKYPNISIKGEKGILKGDADNIEKFIQFCKDNDIPYLTDYDSRERLTDEDKEERKKFATIHKLPSARIFTDNGTTEDILSLSELLTGDVDCESDCQKAKGQKGFRAKGWYCSRDMDNVYIMQNIHMGTSEGECRQFSNLSQFHPSKVPIKCPFSVCNLCGGMSIAQDRELFDKIMKETF